MPGMTSRHAAAGDEAHLRDSRASAIATSKLAEGDRLQDGAASFRHVGSA